MFWEVVRSVKAAAPLASSVRKKRAAGAPAVPSPRYIRVFPFGSFVTSNEGRSGSVAGFVSGPFSRLKVVPPFSERHVPWLSAAAYTMLELLGSSARSITPRFVLLPSQMKVKLAPPSVDLNRPYGGLGVVGFAVAVAWLTELTPRTPRAEAT